MTVEETLNGLVDQFHKKMEEDEEARKKISTKEIRMVFKVEGDNTYHFHLKDAKIIDFGIGEYDTQDIYVTTDKETFEKLQNKEMSPMKAFMTKKITFEGSMADLLYMRDVLGA